MVVLIDVLDKGLLSDADRGSLASGVAVARVDAERQQATLTRLRGLRAAGLHAARASARNGRPTIMSADKLAAARRIYGLRELSGEQIAWAFGVSRSTLYRALTKAGAVKPVRPPAEPERGR